MKFLKFIILKFLRMFSIENIRSPLQVIELDPNSYYLVVLKTTEHIPEAGIRFMSAVMTQKIVTLLGDVHCEVVILENLDLDIIQFKPIKGE